MSPLQVRNRTNEPTVTTASQINGVNDIYDMSMVEAQAIRDKQDRALNRQGNPEELIVSGL